MAAWFVSAGKTLCLPMGYFGQVCTRKLLGLLNPAKSAGVANIIKDLIDIMTNYASQKSTLGSTWEVS